MDRDRKRRRFGGCWTRRTEVAGGLVFIDKVLGPTLKQGDIVVMDTLPAHKGEVVKTASRPPAPASCCCRATRQTSIRLS